MSISLPSRPLICAALSALAMTPWIHADSSTLNPVADAYVRDGGSASTNYGGSTQMETRGATGAHRRSYIKFDVSGINGTVSDATLGLYGNTSGGTQTTNAHAVSNNTWTEGGITWNNMPSIGSSLDSIDIDTTGYTYWELDVTSHVAAAVAASQSHVTIALENSTDASSVNKFRSREYSNTSERPTLAITSSASSGSAPSISSQPQNDTVDVGEDATFSVTASGNPTPTYQWRFEGSNISGATTHTLSLTDVQTSDAGDYDVVVTNSNGSVTSNTATLTVNTPATPIIDEDFSGSAGDFTEVTGGTWAVSSGRYVLSSPASAGNGLLGNISVHNTAVTGNDYSVSAVLNITGTGSAWNDGALIFGYQDDANFYYVSLNESNDSYTKGVFKVVSGSPTELADISSSIASDTDYPIDVVRDDASIVVYLNSSQVASTTDSTFSGGQIGFGSKNDSAQFDDLVVYGTASAAEVDAPQFSPDGGIYTTAQSVAIMTSTSGATIRYTTDGSTPTSTSGTVYSSAVSISSTTTLKAIAYKNGITDSPVTSATYTINSGTVAAPQFSPGGGTYSSSQSVTITTSTSGASIRYTTDGSTPTSTSGTVYSSAVSISSTSTLKAIAYKSGMTDSGVTSATYTISTGGGPTKPSASNTGPSGSLTASGAFTITTNNAVIEDLDISGTIKVQADNVTIRNCRITTGGYYGIQSIWGNTGLLIEDCEIQGMLSAGIYAGNFTARRCHIHNSGADGMKPTGNYLVESCYFTDLGYIPTSHADGIQMVAGSDGLIRWNTFDMISGEDGYKNSQCLIIQTNNGVIDNIVITENWINGGGASVQIRDKGNGYGPPTNCEISYNQFGRDAQGSIMIIDGSPLIIGNVWEDTGEPAP